MISERTRAMNRTVQNILSSLPSFLPKNVNIKIHKFVILAAIFMGVKLGLSHEGNYIYIYMFENRLLREVFGSKREEVRRSWRKLRKNELVLFTKCY
jgi:hypothetical protein